MTRYAVNTEVSSEKSRAEIERILTRYNADQFAYGWTTGGAMVAYEQAVRQRWRALALCIKAKLEAVEAAIIP